LLAKISAKRFQSDTLDFDFARGAKAHASKNWYRWTPPLDGVLK
jgi:hypothetical protein